MHLNNFYLPNPHYLLPTPNELSLHHVPLIFSCPNVVYVVVGSDGSF